MSGIFIGDPAADYISPADACINPVHVNKSNARVGGSAPTIIKLESDYSGQVWEEMEGSHQKLEPAKITLADCLACSGCVTSAETVLISLQSVEKLKQVLSEISLAKAVSIWNAYCIRMANRPRNWWYLYLPRHALRWP